MDAETAAIIQQARNVLSSTEDPLMRICRTYHERVKAAEQQSPHPFCSNCACVYCV